MSFRFRQVLAIAVLALAPGVSRPALAQDQPPPTDVGRVSYVSGHLAFTAGTDTSGWTAATLNYPIAAGAWLWTDPHARSEIRVGPDTIAMSDNTELNFVALSQQTIQLGLSQGRVELHARDLAAGGTIEIDMPRGSVWLLQPGIYDISAGGDDAPARVAVFTGSARFAGGGADLTIKAGEAASLSGTTAVAATVGPATRDAFAEWCRSRAYEPSRLAASRYLSPWMTGYADLDAYGRWAGGTSYGEVWYPNSVPAGWAPYHDGRWVWMPDYGWSWVDAEPWGFAPFHYGRWARIDDRWGWVPGRREAPPVYAPALVAFLDVGAGSHGPAVGWFPLAPNEPYYPTYTHDRDYLRRINAGHVRDDNALAFGPGGGPPPAFAHRDFANHPFATVVPQHVFANAGLTAAAAFAIAAPVLHRATVAMRPPQDLRPEPEHIHPVGPVAAPHPVRPAMAAPEHGAGPHSAGHEGNGPRPGPHPAPVAVAPVPPREAGPHHEAGPASHEAGPHHEPVAGHGHPSPVAVAPVPPHETGPRHEAGPAAHEAGPHHEAAPGPGHPAPVAVAPVPPHEAGPHREAGPAPHAAGPRHEAGPAAHEVEPRREIGPAPHAPVPGPAHAPVVHEMHRPAVVHAPAAVPHPQAPERAPAVFHGAPHPPAAPHVEAARPPARPTAPAPHPTVHAAPPHEAPHGGGKGGRPEEEHH